MGKGKKYEEEYDEELEDYEEDYEDDDEEDYEDDYDDEENRAYFRHKRRIRNQTICIIVMIVLVLALLAGIGYGSFKLTDYIHEQKKAQELNQEIRDAVEENKEPATIETPEE